MTPRFVIDSARLAGAPLLRAQTDQRLIDLVRAGNDRAFEAIVDRYRRPLLRYCSRLLPAARAEDAVQQAFINAFGAMRRGDADLELRPWLYRIARNACLNALRDNRVRQEQIEKLGEGSESAHDALERRQEIRSVMAAVSTLPERQREAMVLREFEGRSYDQIAAQLEVSDGAVRQLLNRARNTLRAGVTAITPFALIARLQAGASQPVVAQAAEAAGHEGARMGLARAAGMLTATLAVAGGITEGAHQLTLGARDLQSELRTAPHLSALPPPPPSVTSDGLPALGAGAGVTTVASNRAALIVRQSPYAVLAAARAQGLEPSLRRPHVPSLTTSVEAVGGHRGQSRRHRAGSGRSTARTLGRSGRVVADSGIARARRSGGGSTDGRRTIASHSSHRSPPRAQIASARRAPAHRATVRRRQPARRPSRPSGHARQRHSRPTAHRSVARQAHPVAEPRRSARGRQGRGRAHRKH